MWSRYWLIILPLFWSIIMFVIIKCHLHAKWSILLMTKSCMKISPTFVHLRWSTKCWRHRYIVMMRRIPILNRCPFGIINIACIWFSRLFNVGNLELIKVMKSLNILVSILRYYLIIERMTLMFFMFRLSII